MSAEYLTYEEAALELGFEQDGKPLVGAIRERVRTGILPYVRRGSQRMISRKDIEAFRKAEDAVAKARALARRHSIQAKPQRVSSEVADMLGL